MTTTLALSPLFRQSIGFDRFNDLFEAALKNDERTENAYPPYNIEKLGDDEYRITMAVAGFTDADLTITAQGNSLHVAGRIEQKKADGVEYLHRGIAARAFERKFSLADHVKVTGASLDHGLLQVHLVREVPDAAKPRMIEIASGTGKAKGKVIEGKAVK